ncbi:MAG: hypothetical protein NTZ68_00810 [Candidatus Dependentiae bacterium]|nr:hypothetical protein [Candidatus Dependentiae bacterium]
MTKNTILLAALFAFSSLVNANVETIAKTAKVFTFEYTVQPKSSDFTDWNNANASLLELANKVQTKSSGSSFYQSVLVFIKEMQEAIAAGLNLFGSVSTSQDSFSEIIQDITAEAIEQNVKESVAAALGSTKSTEEENVATEVEATQEAVVSEVEAIEEVVATEVIEQATQEAAIEAQEVLAEEALVEEVLAEEAQDIPSITISLSLLATDLSDEATWTTAKEMLEDFAQQATAGNMSPDVFVEKLTAIFEFVDQSSLHGSLQIASKAA